MASHIENTARARRAKEVSAKAGTILNKLERLLMNNTLKDRNCESSALDDEGLSQWKIGDKQGLRLMKERKRVAWLLLLLAVLFAMCWLPYNIMQLLLDINVVSPKDLSAFLPYALFIGHANSAINPIVYCLMTRNFQRSAHKLLCERGVCKPSKFKWHCTQKADGSSSVIELYQEPHKRCYIQMNTLRNNCHTHGVPSPKDVESQADSQLSHVTHLSRRTAPAHTLSEDMLQRHTYVAYQRSLSNAV